MEINAANNNATKAAATPKRLMLRLMAAIVVSSLGMAVLVISLQVHTLKNQSVAKLTQRFQEIESSFIPTLSIALWQMDRERQELIINSLQQLSDVGQVVLLDETGHKIQRENPHALPILASKSFQLVFKDEQEQYVVGQLQVAMTGYYINQQINATVWSIAVSTLTVVLIGALLMLILFRRWLSRHLQQLARYTQQMELTTLDQPLQLDRPQLAQPDELDLVVNAINQLRQRILDELAQRQLVQDELAEHKNNLELLVEQRTKALAIQTKELQAQNVELDAYAHTVAHDLKHPLTSIVGWSSLLTGAEAQLSAEQRGMALKEIHTSAQKMNDIIHALLQLASVRREEDIQSEVIAVGQLATEALKRLAVFSQQHGAQIQQPASMPDALGQAQWIEEVWVNLISNAIKYGGDKPIVELGTTQLENGQQQYWVRDFGQGLSDADQQLLFQKFTRFDLKSSDGHGLGLSIVKRIVDKLKGEVGYQKLPDGSLFWFSLPAVTSKS